MAAYDIITAAEFKAYAGLSGSTKDTIIGTFISDVSLWIEEYLGRKVAGSQTVTEEVGHGDDSEFFVPKFPPVSAVTTLKYRASPSGTWTDIVSDTDNILIDPINGDYVELYGTVFPAGRNNIQITYTAGYSTVPNTIKQTCYEMVMLRFRESNDSAIGDNRLGVAGESESNPGGSTSSKTYQDMLPKWKEILKPYRMKRAVSRGSGIVQMGR